MTSLRESISDRHFVRPTFSITRVCVSYHPLHFCEPLFFLLAALVSIVPISRDRVIEDRSPTILFKKDSTASLGTDHSLRSRAVHASITASLRLLRQTLPASLFVFVSSFFFIVIFFVEVVNFQFSGCVSPPPLANLRRKKKRRTTTSAVVLFFNSKSGCPRSSCFVSSFDAQHSPLPPTFRLAAIFSHERKRHASIAALD